MLSEFINANHQSEAWEKTVRKAGDLQGAWLNDVDDVNWIMKCCESTDIMKLLGKTKKKEWSVFGPRCLDAVDEDEHGVIWRATRPLVYV